MKPIIGILGGMGPRATVEFEQLLIEKIGGSDQDIPTIVSINDGSIPDRSAYVLGYGEDPVPKLQQNLDRLVQINASIICMPCNTACTPGIFNRLNPGSSRLLNIPSIVSEHIKKARLGKVFVMATKGTMRSSVYSKILASHKINYIIPNPREQLLVDNLIRSIKRGDTEASEIISGKIKDIIIDRNCDGVILGCTELPLMSDLIVPKYCQAINTLELLADECLSLIDTQLIERDYDARPIYN